MEPGLSSIGLTPTAIAWPTLGVSLLRGRLVARDIEQLLNKYILIYFGFALYVVLLFFKEK